MVGAPSESAHMLIVRSTCFLLSVLFKPTYGVRAEHSKLFGRLGITLSSHHKFKKEDLVTNNAELFSDPVDKHLPSQAIPVDIQMVQDRLAKLRIYSEVCFPRLSLYSITQKQTHY